MLPRRGHRASSWRRYREGNVRPVAAPGSVSLVIVGSKDRRVARRGRNYRLSRCDAGHTLTCLAYCRTVPIDQGATCDRSEEHTSELQSRFDIVCRLLLEKKKKHL